LLYEDSAELRRTPEALEAVVFSGGIMLVRVISILPPDARVLKLDMEIV
jgi:hypothetical protein